MDYKDIRTLRLLEEIDNSYTPSQRDLAHKLNISLGLVNAFVKRLAHMGYFKISTIPKNRVKYILTPKGAAEKTRLTYEYIQFSFQFYRKARALIKKLFLDLEEQGRKRIVFYGASELAEIAFISLQETSIRLVAVVDNIKSGEKFFGFTIQDSGALSDIFFDRIVITTMNSEEMIIDQIIENGIPRDKVALIN
jgi:DNA-binding MarR family transcriptional regulator